MHGSVLLYKKIKTLRKLETIGYQIAFYVLQDENLAIAANKKTLLVLFEENSFFYKPLLHQKEIMKK